METASVSPATVWNWQRRFVLLHLSTNTGQARKILGRPKSARAGSPGGSTNRRKERNDARCSGPHSILVGSQRQHEQKKCQAEMIADKGTSLDTCPFLR
eukprot:5107221-Amphidinium_carterae.1